MASVASFAPGSLRSSGGSMSGRITRTSLPRCPSTCISASDEPAASPSGALWVTTTMRSLSFSSERSDFSLRSSCRLDIILAVSYYLAKVIINSRISPSF